MKKFIILIALLVGCGHPQSRNDREKYTVERLKEIRRQQEAQPLFDWELVGLALAATSASQLHGPNFGLCMVFDFSKLASKR